jgi:hypothetical protein
MKKKLREWTILVLESLLINSVFNEHNWVIPQRESLHSHNTFLKPTLSDITLYGGPPIEICLANLNFFFQNFLLYIFLVFLNFYKILWTFKKIQNSPPNKIKSMLILDKIH